MASSGRPQGRPVGTTTTATRAKLLRAAREVFAERGYAGAAIADVVARAGVSTPVLYHHFESKAGVYAAATAWVYDDVLAHLEPAVAGLTSFGECVDAILVESARMHEQDPTLAAFIVSAPAVVTNHPELAPLTEQFRRTEIFFSHVVDKTGGIDGHSRIESVRVLRMLVWGMTRLSATLPDAAEFAAAVEALRSVVVRGALMPRPPLRRKPRVRSAAPVED